MRKSPGNFEAGLRGGGEPLLSWQRFFTAGKRGGEGQPQPVRRVSGLGGLRERGTAALGCCAP